MAPGEGALCHSRTSRALGTARAVYLLSTPVHPWLARVTVFWHYSGTVFCILYLVFSCIMYIMVYGMV